jgi:hypothetical protein
MNLLRKMLLTETRDRWVTVRNLRHATAGEKQLADVMIAECNALISENETTVGNTPNAIQTSAANA